MGEEKAAAWLGVFLLRGAGEVSPKATEGAVALTKNAGVRERRGRPAPIVSFADTSPVARGKKGRPPDLDIPATHPI